MPIMEAAGIPAGLDDLTSSWLTDALRSAGRLADGKVERIETEPIGDGEGFMGVIARLRLGYDGDAEALPSTLIAKLPIGQPENRMMGELMGVYWREIHFYEELAGRVPIRTPGHHYSALTADPMRFRQYKIVRVLDRLPGFLVDPMMRHARKTVSESPHRYVLLLEDLGGLRVGDQVGGGSPEACARVLAAAARLHARFWGDPGLRKLEWLADQDATPHIRHRMYVESRKTFLGRHRKALGDDGMRIVEFNDRHGVAMSRRVHKEAPETLIHCDLRLDNVFFDDATPDDPVVLADWQLVGRGGAAYDVAYLLGGALAADTPVDVEMDLLRGYHDALCAEGVTGYGFDRLLRDYRRGLLAGFQMICTTDQMELGDERGFELIDLWIERAIGRLRAVDLASLL